MANLTPEDRQALVKLAQSAIAAELDPTAAVQRPQVLSEALKEKRGCFVTLHKKGQLRGCIGTIEPVRPLVENVEENARNAAFRDPRFPALTSDELPEIDLEVSVLTVPEILAYKDPVELKRKLVPGTHGVIITSGWHSATFLPQVWDQLPDPETFLSHLCRKAGMQPGCWQSKDVIVKVYRAEYFSE
jgi:AmmeMemoRadiSam system protein A